VNCRACLLDRIGVLTNALSTPRVINPADVQVGDRHHPNCALSHHRRTCCAWSADDDGNWDTACGQKHILIEGTPADNRMAFCCYCGGKLAAERARRAQETQGGSRG
jgi:hypothetical protein